MKKIAIVQSNYIPWKGYFDLIANVDEFVLYDDMQYTRRDWRNRNKIKTSQGLKWLTIPVKVKGKYLQKIRCTEVENPNWAISHWNFLKLNYQKSEYFDEVASLLRPVYLEESFSLISSINRRFIEVICDYLDISTKITNSWDYHLEEGKTSRLAGICKQANATHYVSGPSAKDYMEVEIFRREGIELSWIDYSNYSEHPQLWGDFVHEVSILDLLFNCGKKSSLYMKYVDKTC